ncbi:YpoC family protein [Planococcus dechangensis]|uniref:YpoC family protein n=1 Tax=Planococcus dechangensis TaxID=1176255 RepID=A0ABV9MAW5_9BACL
MSLSQKSIDDAISPYYDAWQGLSRDLHECFKQQPASCRGLISSGYTLYVELKQTLFSLFGESSPAPLNEEERLDFVYHSNSAHAAFRQLEQLFRELKKKIARLKIGYPVK